MDESHSSMQGAVGGKGSVAEEIPASGGSVGRGDFSNQEEHYSNEEISHPASE